MKSCIMHVVEPDARPKKVGRILAELKAELEVCSVTYTDTACTPGLLGRESVLSSLARLGKNF